MSVLARLWAFLGWRPEAAPAAASTTAQPAPAPVAAPAVPVPAASAWGALAARPSAIQNPRPSGPIASGALTARDRERLRGVRPELVRVVERARGSALFLVSEGLRTTERQAQLVAAGASKTMRSRHITGHAVDLYPISDTPIPQMTRADFEPIVAAMRQAAADLGIRMEHGHDWGWDSPHHELHRLAYPPPPS